MIKQYKSEGSRLSKQHACPGQLDRPTLREAHKKAMMQGERAYKKYRLLEDETRNLGIDGKIGIVAACINHGMHDEAEIIRIASRVAFAESNTLARFLLHKFRGNDPEDSLWGFDPRTGYSSLEVPSA